MTIQEVLITSLKLRDDLKLNIDFEDNPIVTSLQTVLPLSISDDVKLIILGQDPTVKNQPSRIKIEYTFSHNKSGLLKKYIIQIYSTPGIPFENIYATNEYRKFQ